MAERRTSSSEAEVDRVCQTVFTWHRYSPEVKAELFSTAVLSDSSAFLVDPIEIDLEVLRAAIAPRPISGVVVTNENHARAAAEAATAFAVPLYAHRNAREAVGLSSARELTDGDEFAPSFTAVAIEGAPAGEVAIYVEAEGGTLVIGDALINMGEYGFALLPAKYCTNQKQMRRSLRKLLAFDFERIVFAHGLPVVTHAKQRLADLLESGS